jgi:hypothetical protein
MSESCDFSDAGGSEENFDSDDSDADESTAGASRDHPSCGKRARYIRRVNCSKPRPYSQVKQEAEQRFAYLGAVEYKGYIEILEEGGFAQISLKDLAEFFKRTYFSYEAGESKREGSASFFPTWRKDAEMRTFSRIVYDHSNEDEDAINALPLPKALVLLRSKEGTMTSREVDAYSEWFWDLLVDRIPDQAQREFLLCQFANMVQNPTKPSRVFTILSGPQGSGKNTILDFMVDQILGPQLARGTTDLTKDVFGTHANALKLKVMVPPPRPGRSSGAARSRSSACRAPVE